MRSEPPKIAASRAEKVPRDDGPDAAAAPAPMPVTSSLIRWRVGSDSASAAAPPTAAIAAVGGAAAEAESDPTLQRIRELVTGIGAGAAAASGPSSRGTFSAREAAIFGGSERIDREMLDRQEQILRVVDRIAQQLLRNPFVLGP